MRHLKSLLVRLGTVVALALPVAAHAAAPGCVGKMWNPMADLDFTLMGGIRIAGQQMMEEPEELGEPPQHRVGTGCACENGLQTGAGVALSFWMPSYINDMARSAGCLGFLGPVSVMNGFSSLNSGQEYSKHEAGKDGTTNMQIHWAYADVTAVAGRQLFEKCNAVSSKFNIAYMTEADFLFQNDVYSAIMAPQAAILAATPILSHMACGVEAMANTLGDWRDFGICGWKGFRLPMSGNVIGKDSAQVSNMDITVRYLTRASLLGLNLKTMGDDVMCEPKYSPFYQPFQHRYQWAYPGRVATRYNIDVVRWGMFIKNGDVTSIAALATDTSGLGNTSATTPSQSEGTPLASGGGLTAPTGDALGLAASIMAKVPKPLNYPTREAGYMQVWEARQCCIIMVTVANVIQKVVENYLSGGSQFMKEMLEYYHQAQRVYTVVQAVANPVEGALSAIGGALETGVGSAVEWAGSLF